MIKRNLVTQNGKNVSGSIELFINFKFQVKLQPIIIVEKPQQQTEIL